jgi:hypothetical protein
MNCHEDNKGKHSPLKHMLHMVICCGLPIVIIGLLPFISKFSPGSGRMLGFIVPFLCPIMMIGMLPMMLGGSHSQKENCCDNKNVEEQPKLNKPLE